MDASPSPPARWIAVSLFALTLLVYLARPLCLQETFLGGGGDTVPTRLLPVSLLREGNLDLDEFPQFRGQGCPYFLVHANNHYYSAYPVGGAFLITPIFGGLHLLGIDVFGSEAVRAFATAGTAALLSALAVLLTYLTYAPRGPYRALAVAVLFGFATGVWPTCAQDLWQQTFGILLMSLCLLLLERGFDDARWLGWLGLPIGCLIVVRPSNAILGLVLALAVARLQPRQLLRLAGLALPFVVLTVWLNVATLGHPLGGYQAKPGALHLATLPVGIPGLLLSPSHGLLVYSPIVLFAVLAWRGNEPDARRFLKWVLLALFVVQLIFYGAFDLWYGGYCFGPRYLLEVMPACAGLLWYAWPTMSAGRLARSAVGLAATWSILANASGYWFGWYQWCAHPDVDRCMQRLWDWRDSPLACVVLGLPDRCPHSLTGARAPWEFGGVALRFGRGWSSEPDGTFLALGSAAELLLDLGGRPALGVLLTLQPEPDLAGPQVLTARINDREVLRTTLADGRCQPLFIPLTAEQQQRLTLHFSHWRRRKFLDIRPVAAGIKNIQIGFRQG